MQHIHAKYGDENRNNENATANAKKPRKYASSNAQDQISNKHGLKNYMDRLSKGRFE